MKKLIIGLLLLTSCNKNYDKKYFSDGVINKISYFKDERTEICFAWVNLDSRSITCVPCEKAFPLDTLK